MLRKIFVYCLYIASSGATAAIAQSAKNMTTISLDNLDAFQNPGKNWNLAADAVADYTKDQDIKPIAGKGAVVNIVGKSDNTPLTTNESFGDVQIELDFMMTRNSNSGVYLQGRYEVQLFDSWTKLNPTFSDCGGIYQRWDDARGSNNEGYEGIAPLMNVSKAPGLWQHLLIKFRAPKFNDKGEKIANARFDEVYLNGKLIQLQSSVTGPTRSSIFNDEKPTGPLVLQGDHGNVAFRNIQYGPIDETPVEMSEDNPITVKANGKPYLLRSFLNYGDKKLTHVISAGYPNQLNYSYDLKQGAIFQIWRGEFLDVTDMWHERGEPQLAKPLGSVITLSDAPALAVLATANAAWTDSIGFDDFHNEGYTLDENRFASFAYTVNNMHVTDKIAAKNATSLNRQLDITNAPANLYCRIASAGKIELIGKDLFAIDGKSYYLNVAESFKPQIRQTQNGQELIVALPANTASLTYSITW
ncbi:MAG: DUF1080 domain-containing protein [Chitinophagaceae bacterium]